MKMLVACVMLPISALVVPACGSDKAATVASTTDEPGVTWKYLKTQYGGFLSNRCPAKLFPGPEYTACIGVQDAGIGPFKIDATELPASKDRANLLDTINRYEQNYKKYTDEYCQIKKTKDMTCTGQAIMLDMGIDTMSTIVTKQAEKE